MTSGRIILLLFDASKRFHVSASLSQENRRHDESVDDDARDGDEGVVEDFGQTDQDVVVRPHEDEHGTQEDAPKTTRQGGDETTNEIHDFFFCCYVWMGLSGGCWC